MQEAKLDHAFVTKFCEQMLFRPGMPLEGAMTPREWTQQKQILLKYVQVSCNYLAHQQAVADARMAQVPPPLICRLACHSHLSVAIPAAHVHICWSATKASAGLLQLQS